jgi:mannosyl-oligosaccharide alpha-1,2-mannosidase
MALSRRRLQTVLVCGSIVLMLLYLWSDSSISGIDKSPNPPLNWQTDDDDDFMWKKVPVHYPVTSIRPLPTGIPVKFPSIQAAPGAESKQAREVRQKRQSAVKEAFSRCWGSYRKHAWLSDELTPISGSKRDTFGGWAATLVDSLDTLWIMDMKEEFAVALDALDEIDFTRTDVGEINVFETNIRYLGGFLAAFDLSGDVRLLRKAVQVGELLYKAFDTPNRMPITRWDVKAAADGEKQLAPNGLLVAEIGSFSMEFTRLSMITQDPKWFDAIQRITDVFAAQQDSTSLPGLWPLVVNPEQQVFNWGSDFTLGAMADSVYEYLPKMAALLGGTLLEYQTMYEKAMKTAIKYNIFRPMTSTDEDILISGQAHVKGQKGQTRVELEPQGQHLVCFLGGLMALGGKLFGIEEHISIAQRLVDGCIWTYKEFPHGIMSETLYMAPCKSTSKCTWDEKIWYQHILQQAGLIVPDNDQELRKRAEKVIADKRLPKGITSIPDGRYILRPEAIESVFILYRITGKPYLLESAWNMWQAIDNSTKTDLANSAIADVTYTTAKAPRTDSMESFWMGETLKYFYLIFSEPGLISLDEFVFNTEAHPLRRLIR